MEWWLPVMFGVAAFLYAMAGFGGGSTYIALLLLAHAPLPLVPIVGLVCNLLVTSQGSVRLARSGWVRPRFLAPLLLTSIPASFFAGAWKISEGTFLIILAAALSLAGIALLITTPPDAELESSLKEPSGWSSRLALGGILGGLAGITGIGGGIYLSPALHLLRWARAKEIAATASIFIVVNSAAGLLGQLTKSTRTFEQFLPYLACPLSVLIGGWIGSTLMLHKLDPSRVRSVTGALVLLVAVNLWFRILGG